MPVMARLRHRQTGHAAYRSRRQAESRLKQPLARNKYLPCEQRVKLGKESILKILFAWESLRTH